MCMSTSTKDDIGASLSVSADMRLTMSKQAFLANPSNKQALINLIAVDMSSACINIEHSQGDADYVICLLACSSAKDKPTVVVADDTDVFQLLVHHADSTNDNAELHMGTSRQIISIKTLKNNLDHKLPHTSDAAALHSRRTYHQVQAWYGRDIPAGEWGWEQSPNGQVPTIMNQAAAPETLLKIIHCKCTGQCDRKSCTCCKHGLHVDYMWTV